VTSVIHLPPKHPAVLEYLPNNEDITEADFYGFTISLARHLNLTSVPKSIRRFQHGWFWWHPLHDEKLTAYLALTGERGIIVQDCNYSKYLTKAGVFSIACGLPFIAYRKYLSSAPIYERKGLLYVPMHSSPGADYSEHIVSEVEAFSEIHTEFSLLLSVSDLSLIDKLSRYTQKIYLGAGSKEIHSLERLEYAFASHEYVCTTNMGSHVFYAAACGCKVYLQGLKEIENKFDLDLIATGRYGDWYKSVVYTEPYLKIKFPELLRRNGSSGAVYQDFPEVADVNPKLLALALGWPL